MAESVKVVYCGYADEVDVPAYGLANVRNGIPIEVPAEVAEHLLESANWRRAAAASPSLAAPAARRASTTGGGE